MKTSSIVVLVAVIVIMYNAVFTVDMTQHAVVLQLQEYKTTVSEPGLYFKIPIIQDVQYFSKQLLVNDAPPADVITKDKKTMLVDNYSMWRIIDPLLFFQTVRTIPEGMARLDDIINSELRVELGVHNLIDVVTKTREDIMEKVTKEVAAKATEYGIEVTDVRIKRADLPEQNAKKVYDRMRTERERKSKEYRAQGKEEATKIRAETDKDKKILIAQAYKQEQTIRGDGDAKATKIYADAFNKDPKFYAFIRSMQAYKNSFQTDTTILLSEKSEFLEFLNQKK